MALLGLPGAFWLTTTAKWKLLGSGGLPVTGTATGRNTSPQATQTATDKMTPSSAYLRQAVGAMPRNSLLVIFIGKNFHSTGKRINALAALSYQQSQLRAFAMANQVSDKTHLLKWMRQTGGRVAATRQGVGNFLQ